MPDETTGGGLTVTLYVQSLRQGGCTAATVDRLVALADRGAVDSYDVVVWGDRAPPSAASAETTMGEYICDRVALFREWARRNDVTLDRALVRDRVDSGITGEAYEQLRLPTLLAAVYSGDRLDCVVPHEADGEVVTVPAFLDGLDEGMPADYVPVERGRIPPPTPDARGSDGETAAVGSPASDLPLSPTPADDVLHEDGADDGSSESASPESPGPPRR